MKYLLPVGGITDHDFGILTAPNHKGIPQGIVNGMMWAADLGCVDGPEYVKRINCAESIAWLEKMDTYRGTCLFLSGGDVVGNARLTLDKYAEFEKSFSGWLLAYVAQDGAESLDIPETCRAVFIGGSTVWKCSQQAVEVIKRAQGLGKHIHIGRVNFKKRYNIFRVLEGSNDFTCDGTRPRFEGTNRAVKAWSDYQKQIPLFGL